MLQDTRILRLARVLAVLLVSVVAIRVAWISDDALITLRTALNITHNWGPGYNATEAVQAYTHPLWFLLWVWVGSWTNQWILGILALGIVFVALATALLVQRATSVGRVIIVTAFLLLSNAFIDYTSSGLENPLSYAGIAVVMTLSITAGTSHSIRWWWALLLGLSAAAVFLTRMDLIVLLVIPLAVLLWLYRRNVAFIVIGVASFLVPLIAWFAWTNLTYAAWLPNTFAAKTNADIPRGEFIVQGLRYLWVSFENDPVTLIGLALGIGVGIAVGTPILRAWAIGTLVYIGYVVWIGGDFMGGRFLAAPFFVAIFILAATPLRSSKVGDEVNPLVPLAAAAVVVGLLVAGAFAASIKVTALANPQGPRWEVDQNFNAGVADARGLSVGDGDSLKSMVDALSLDFVDPDFVPIGDGTGLGRPLRNLDKSAKNWPFNDGGFTNPAEVGVFCGYLGNIGIATGPTVHLIDYCALTDRFLANRPFVRGKPFAWKPGHFDRGVPDGYVEAIATGDPSKMRDAADAYTLSQLWEEIR